MLSNSTLHFPPLVSHAHELASDHAPVVSTIVANIETKDSSQIFFYRGADWISYKIYVNERLNLETEFANSNDIDDGLAHLITTIHDARNLSVPLVSKNNKYIRISHDTKIAISERNSLKRQWQRCTQAVRKRQLKSMINEANRKIASG